MRFVDLSRDDGETSHDKVLRLGCGPNFVRNRSDSFEKMIKEQGMQFWFRFWLSFCYNHGVHEFDEVNRLMPGVTTCLLKDIHLNFVQASSDDAINYCWNVIFPNYPPIRRILDELHQFIEIGFGCALGEVFFKWLVAKDFPANVQESKEYWTIPSQYLDPNFQPGQLEKYLVKQWGNKFAKLLGVSRDQVSWIRKLIVLKWDIETENDKKALHHYHIEYSQRKQVRKLVEGWKVKLKHMKNSIQLSDELKKIEEIQNGIKTTKYKSNANNLYFGDRSQQHLEKPFFADNASDNTSISERDGRKAHHCACCTISKRLKKCQRCEDENWPDSRYYCCVACQSKDWFAKHEKEHCQFLQKSLLETAKLHQFLQSASRFKS